MKEVIMYSWLVKESSYLFTTKKERNKNKRKCHKVMVMMGLRGKLIPCEIRYKEGK